jgi:hypothetical protein
MTTMPPNQALRRLESKTPQTVKPAACEMVTGSQISTVDAAGRHELVSFSNFSH